MKRGIAILAIIALAALHSLSVMALADLVIDFANPIVDGKNTTWAGSSNGSLKTQSLGFGGAAIPVDPEVKYNGKPAIRIELRNDRYEWWIGQYWAAKGDLSAYMADGYLEVAYKGSEGGEHIAFGFRPEGSYKDSIYSVTCTTEWQVLRISMKDLKDLSEVWDGSNTDSVFVRNAPPPYEKQKILAWVSDMKIKPTGASQLNPPTPTPGPTATATPTSGGATPTPGGATPTPGGATPTPGGATPTPGGATPTVTESSTDESQDSQSESSDEKSSQEPSEEPSEDPTPTAQATPTQEAVSDTTSQSQTDSDDDESSGRFPVWIVVVVLAVAAIGTGVYVLILKKKT